MIALDDLYYFTEVAKVMSFRQAAASTGVPVSTLSRRVSALETAIGMRLFHRTTRKIELTEAGRAYFFRCKDIIEQAHYAHDEIQGKYIQPSGVLRVTAPVDFGNEIISPLIAEFSLLYPDLRFEFDLSARLADLIAEPFDMAIRIGNLKDSSLVSRRLCSLSRSLYAAPSYIECQGAPDHPRSLKDFHCLSIKAGDGVNWMLSREGETSSVKVASKFVANNATMIKHLAVLGQGIAILADALVKDEILKGQLIPVLPAWSASSVPVYALTESRSSPARVQKFIDFLKDRLTAQFADVPSASSTRSKELVVG